MSELFKCIYIYLIIKKKKNYKSKQTVVKDEQLYVKIYKIFN